MTLAIEQSAFARAPNLRSPPLGSGSSCRVSTNGSHRAQGGLTTSISSATQPEGASSCAVPRPEYFEIDSHGRISRLVSRSFDGAIVRTSVGRVSQPKSKKFIFTQELLAAMADESYLKCRTSPAQLNGDEGDKSEIRVVDMFGGCGAMALGVAEACRALGHRFRMAGTFEIDDAALSVYCRNFGGPEPKRDVERSLSSRLGAPPTRRERALVEEFGRVDFVVAGPPCQGHSNLNNKTRRADPKNELYLRVARFARLVKPKWIVIENVQAVLHDKRNVVGRTVRALRAMGYYVDHDVVSTDDVGVAQTRRRHLLLAVLTARSGQVTEDIPSLAEIVERYRVPHRSVMWAIRDLARLSSNTLFDSASVPSARTRRRIDWLFDRNAYVLKNSQRPKCQQGDHRYIGVYGRMRPAKPGPTITGGYDTMGRGRYVHPTKRRTITPHEAARIQSFPDWFDFSVVKGRARLAQVIGNAVPPKLSYVFALELMR